MSSNKTFRETLAFLIVRDNAHQNAFAKALETLGVNWNKLLPIPQCSIEQYPECRKYIERDFITSFASSDFPLFCYLRKLNTHCRAHTLCM